MALSYSTPSFRRNFLPRRAASLGCLALMIAGIGAGCATSSHLPKPSEADAALYVGGATQVGDQVKVSFPGAPRLNFAQPVRLDGMLGLGAFGEIKVVDKTAKEIEGELLKIYGPELVVKEAVVVVESPGFPVFITGAVFRPGRVLVNRSVTIVEAIMEAGGYDPRRANLKHVQIVRQENGSQRTMVVDVERTLRSAKSQPITAESSSSGESSIGTDRIHASRSRRRCAAVA